MDIYSAQVSVERLLKYLKEIAEKSPPSYANSKLRYRRLAQSCEEIVHIISSMLKEDHLSFEDDNMEFDSCVDDPKLMQNIENMKYDISELEAFISPEVDDKKKLTNKQIVHLYAKYIEASAKQDHRCKEVNEICILLWTWFNFRFLLSTSKNKNFRYQPSKIADWLKAIVLSYGNSVEDGSGTEFVLELSDWCKSTCKLESANSSEFRYSIPYKVYMNWKDCKRVSLTSVVLWDIICTSCLSELSSTYHLIDENSMYDTCKQVSPSALDRYKNYINHPEILEEIQLHSGGKL